MKRFIKSYKFGEERFYIDKLKNEIRKYSEKYENFSNKFCELFSNLYDPKLANSKIIGFYNNEYVEIQLEIYFEDDDPSEYSYKIYDTDEFLKISSREILDELAKNLSVNNVDKF